MMWAFFIAIAGALGLLLWRRPRLRVTLPPMAWLFLFFALPFLVLLKISFAEGVFQMPPYTPLAEWDGWRLNIGLNFENYVWLFEDPLYVAAYLESIQIAGIATLFCLLIGYPMAYYIATRPPTLRFTLLMLVILPFWTSFLLRVYAWMGFLSNQGLINGALMGLGIIDQPIQMMQTDFAVYVVITYTYLPFMILPLYAVLSKLDQTLLEASADLGAPPLQTFFTVTLPLSLPGVIAGCLLVFIPAVGEYVIPALMGGPDTLMIGRVLWDEFKAPGGWPAASALAMVLLAILVLPLMFLRAAGGVKEDS